MLEDESQGVQAAAEYSATLRCVSNVDCYQILLLPTPGRTVHDTKEVCWHTFLTWVPKVIRRSYVKPRNVGEWVHLGGTPLMLILGRHCASVLSRLKKATSHFAALRVRRACWLQLTILSTSACILRATSSFLRLRQTRAR